MGLKDGLFIVLFYYMGLRTVTRFSTAGFSGKLMLRYAVVMAFVVLITGTTALVFTGIFVDPFDFIAIPLLSMCAGAVVDKFAYQNIPVREPLYYNTVSCGTALMAVEYFRGNIYSGLMFIISCALGYSLTLIIVYLIYSRMDHNRISRGFRGIPVLLAVIGILMLIAEELWK